MAKATKVTTPKVEEQVTETVQPIAEIPTVTVIEADNDSVGQSHELVEIEVKTVVEQVAGKSDKTLEEKITDYINTRGNIGFVKLNDWLKSLYPIKPNEPPTYLRLEASKEIRLALSNLANSGFLQMQDDRYLQLSKPYHYGTEQFAANKTIADIDIYAKINTKGK